MWDKRDSGIRCIRSHPVIDSRVYNAGTEFREQNCRIMRMRLFLSGGVNEMKVIVDYDRCEGHGRCVLTAPEVFELRSDDQSHVLIERPGEELRPKVAQAVRLCPRQAISLIEE
jgi:ferredoxin